MSVEQFFFSEGDRSVKRYGPGIPPGMLSVVVDTSKSQDSLIISRCDKDDAGGISFGLQADEYTLEGDDGFDIPDAVLERVHTLKSMTGVLFKGHVRLLDGETGVLVVMHNDTKKVQRN